MKKPVSSGAATHKIEQQSRVALSFPLAVNRSPTCSVCTHSLQSQPEAVPQMTYSNHRSTAYRLATADAPASHAAHLAGLGTNVRFEGVKPEALVPYVNKDIAATIERAERHCRVR